MDKWIYGYLDIWIYGYMDIEDLIMCLVGSIVSFLDIWVDQVPARFLMISDGSRTIPNDIHNSGRQAASVTHFGLDFAHLSGILEGTGP